MSQTRKSDEMTTRTDSNVSSYYSRSEAVDLEADFKPNLLNSAVYLISLSQQVSTFAVNFQGRPFREGITENPTLYYGLLYVPAWFLTKLKLT